MITVPRDALFVDTSGWAGPVLQSDPQHEALMRYAQQLNNSKRPLVTTDDVLGELVALLTTRSPGMPRSRLIQFFNQIRSMPQVNIIHIDERTWNEAWALLEQRRDKLWSLVDASSFVLMRQMGLTETFTTDHHFSQAGFLCVP